MANDALRHLEKSVDQVAKETAEIKSNIEKLQAEIQGKPYTDQQLHDLKQELVAEEVERWHHVYGELDPALEFTRSLRLFSMTSIHQEEMDDWKEEQDELERQAKQVQLQREQTAAQANGIVGRITLGFASTSTSSANENAANQIDHRSTVTARRA